MIFLRINNRIVINKLERFLDSLTARWYSYVAVRVRVGEFLPVPVGGRKLSRHGKADYVLVPVMKTAFTCHGTFYKRRAKNAANSASDCSPIDSVSAAG